MTAPLDLTGRKFTRLRVLSRGPNTRRNGRSWTTTWVCYCDPGLGGRGATTKPVLRSNLIQGYTRSCGCLQRETGRARGLANGGKIARPAGAAESVDTVARLAEIHRLRRDGQTLAAIGTEVGLTEERVRQLLLQPDPAAEHAP